MGIHVTYDNFVWLDVTEQCKNGEKAIQELWLANELYAVHDDDSESLLESMDEIQEAIRLHLKICIEVGFIPQQETKLRGWYNKAKKIVHSGYVYVKYNDIKFGKV
jgi:hypothetical protein